MVAQVNTVSQRMLPRNVDAGQTKVVNGRTYTAVANTPIDVPPQDEAVLIAAGWFRTGGRTCVGVGATSGRPLVGGGKLFHGATYVDTTLGYSVVFDGVNWCNPATGAVV